MTPVRRRRLAKRGLVALILAFLLIPTAVAGAQSDRGSRADLVDIEDEVMCIVCKRPLSTSGGDAAEEQRSVIQGFIDDGLTKQQIKDRLVSEYGQKVLVDGTSPVAAAAPVVAALIGAASIWLLLRRRLAGSVRRDDEHGPASDDDRSSGGTPAAPAASADDDARIDAELAERG